MSEPGSEAGKTTTIDVGGVALAVSDEGSGPGFVWGHGLTSSRAHEDSTGLFDWSGLAGLRRLVRYDARGHGNSLTTDGGTTARPEDYRWDSLAGDLLALADALGLDRFAAGGASMGAATVLHAAVVDPGRFTSLVLVIPPTAWETRAGQAGIYEAAASLVESDGVEAFRRAADATPIPAIFADEPELVRFDPAVGASALPFVLRGAAASDLPSLDQLRALDLSVLLLAWESDPGHPVSTATALAEALPDARLSVAAALSEVRHWPVLVGDFLALCDRLAS